MDGFLEIPEGMVSYVQEHLRLRETKARLEEACPRDFLSEVEFDDPEWNPGMEGSDGWPAVREEERRLAYMETVFRGPEAAATTNLAQRDASHEELWRAVHAAAESFVAAEEKLVWEAATGSLPGAREEAFRKEHGMYPPCGPLEGTEARAWDREPGARVAALRERARLDMDLRELAACLEADLFGGLGDSKAGWRIHAVLRDPDSLGSETLVREMPSLLEEDPPELSRSMDFVEGLVRKGGRSAETLVDLEHRVYSLGAGLASSRLDLDLDAKAEPEAAVKVRRRFRALQGLIQPSGGARRESGPEALPDMEFDEAADVRGPRPRDRGRPARSSGMER